MSASDLIKAELFRSRGFLVDRKEDLERAKRHVIEVEKACAGLETKISDLEKDAEALVRGHTK